MNLAKTSLIWSLDLSSSIPTSPMAHTKVLTNALNKYLAKPSESGVLFAIAEMK